MVERSGVNWLYSALQVNDGNRFGLSVKMYMLFTLEELGFLGIALLVYFGHYSIHTAGMVERILLFVVLGVVMAVFGLPLLFDIIAGDEHRNSFRLLYSIPVIVGSPLASPRQYPFLGYLVMSTVRMIPYYILHISTILAIDLCLLAFSLLERGVRRHISDFFFFFVVAMAVFASVYLVTGVFIRRFGTADGVLYFLMFIPLIIILVSRRRIDSMISDPVIHRVFSYRFALYAHYTSLIFLPLMALIIDLSIAVTLTYLIYTCICALITCCIQ